MALRQALGRDVAQEVQPLQPGAVAEVEAGHRVDRLAARGLGAQEVVGGGRQQGLLHRVGLGLVGVPVGLVEGAQDLDILAGQPLRRVGPALAVEPGAEARHRRERHEGLERRHLAAEVLDHLLDQEVAEGDAGQPLLAVRDRVEDRGRRLAGVGVPAFVGEDRVDRRRDGGGERHLDEDQRLVEERRVEEGEAAPVRRLDAPAQVVPARDRVHRLVADDLFQDVGRGGPVDPAQHQEAAVEPRGEQVLEVGIEAVDGLRQRRIRLVGLAGGVAQQKQVLAHPHQRDGAVAGEVEPADQLLRARLGRLVQPAQRGAGRRLLVGRDGAADRVVVGPELEGDPAQEVVPVGSAEAVVAVEDDAGERDP